MANDRLNFRLGSRHFSAPIGAVVVAAFVVLFLVCCCAGVISSFG